MLLRFMQTVVNSQTKWWVKEIFEINRLEGVIFIDYDTLRGWTGIEENNTRTGQRIEKG